MVGVLRAPDGPDTGSDTGRARSRVWTGSTA